MPSDVKVPVMGKTPKGAVIAGVVAVVAVGGYLLYKHLTKPAVPPTTAATGYGYGATGYGYGAGGYGSYGTAGFGGGYPYFGYQGYGGPPPPQGPPTTNAQWGQQAEAALGSSGHDSIAAALGKYLTGATITPTQYQTVQEAIAVMGYPPVAGTNNYPPQAHVSKGGPGPGGGNIPVPNVVGQETDAGVRAIEAAGLTASHPALKPGIGSTITAENPAAGTKVKSGSNVALSIKEK